MRGPQAAVSHARQGLARRAALRGHGARATGHGHRARQGNAWYASLRLTDCLSSNVMLAVSHKLGQNTWLKENKGEGGRLIQVPVTILKTTFQDEIPHWFQYEIGNGLLNPSVL